MGWRVFGWEFMGVIGDRRSEEGEYSLEIVGWVWNRMIEVWAGWVRYLRE